MKKRNCLILADNQYDIDTNCAFLDDDKAFFCFPHLQFNFDLLITLPSVMMMFPSPLRCCHGSIKRTML